MNAKRLALRWLSCACLGLAGLTSIGCPASENDVVLVQRTRPPPSKAAIVDTRLRHQVSTITLSDGVVMSVGCWDNCDYSCESLALAVADTSVVEARTTYRLDGSAPEHVLIARAPGATTLTVSTLCASREYAVTVLGP